MHSALACRAQTRLHSVACTEPQQQQPAHPLLHPPLPPVNLTPGCPPPATPPTHAPLTTATKAPPGTWCTCRPPRSMCATLAGSTSCTTTSSPCARCAHYARSMPNHGCRLAHPPRSPHPRQAELSLTLRRLPPSIKRRGVYLFGMSEGAIVSAAFHDAPFATLLRGRVICRQARGGGGRAMHASSGVQACASAAAT
jgi:hypothetical protein